MIDYNSLVVEDNGSFYFVDETGDTHGPYPTREKAVVMIKAYCIYLEEGYEAAKDYITYMGYEC